MNRDLSIGSTVNEWSVVSEPFSINGKECYTLKCSCGKTQVYHKDYINRANFSKSCRSCSQKKRRIESGKYKIGYKVLNLTIIGEHYQYKGNTFYKVQCDCGHIYHTGHSTFSRKNRLPKCNNCFLQSDKKPKRHNMITYHISKGEYNRLFKNAQNRGIEFTVSPEYLETIFINQKCKCNLTGLDIYINRSQRDKNNVNKHIASLDRIDSSKGYIEGNIQWLYKDINLMKMHFTQEYFINICKLISNHANQQPSS